MPFYEYECATCGVFTALRRMSESGEPALCGECASVSPRIMSAPSLAVLGGAQRAAHDRNERSAHEPKVTRRSNCGCAATHTCKPKSENNRPTQIAAKNPQGFQMQTKKTARPWMVGH